MYEWQTKDFEEEPNAKNGGQRSVEAVTPGSFRKSGI